MLPAVVDSVQLIDALKRGALLHPLLSFIRQQMLHHNIEEETKNFLCAKCEEVVDYSTVSKWLQKFRTGCKDLNNQARLG